MIHSPAVSKSVIQGHYDLSTFFYWLFWGPHIHHGLWERNESSRVAQIQLTERLADYADIRRGQRLLDIGCGMGGSSIHLAHTRRALPGSDDQPAAVSLGTAVGAIAPRALPGFLLPCGCGGGGVSRAIGRCGLEHRMYRALI